MNESLSLLLNEVKKKREGEVELVDSLPSTRHPCAIAWSPLRMGT